MPGRLRQRPDGRDQRLLLRGPDAGDAEPASSTTSAPASTPPPGSAIGRQATAPVGGPLTLTDPALYDGSRAKPFKLPNAPEPAA